VLTDLWVESQAVNLNSEAAAEVNQI
jgi:hypothetical protein